MASRALVLGGGGAVGTAWEIGVLKGLQEAGLDLTAADLIVGTSAGSVVGAQLALGRPLDEMLAEQLAPSTGQLDQAMVFDPDRFEQIALRWATAAEMDAPTRAAIGALALAAPTVDEATWLRVFGERLDGLDWPARRLVITTVEAERGEFVAWEREGGAPLVRAVAASCAVPGIFPPVTIGAARYIDGGVRSSSNADLAQGYGVVVIIAPIGATADGLGRLAQQHLAAESAGLREAGSVVEVLLPDAAALGAFGPNLLDAARGATVAQAGVVQGRVAAEQLRAIWPG